MAVRIGIDVGGTFTDAVAIDDHTFELIGKVKIPTTHHDKDGVAKGIILALNGVLEQLHLSPGDVTFIAHGTTQATNALLEGDVVPVGIIGIGQGVEGLKVKSDTQIGDIELAPGRFLRTDHCYIDLGEGFTDSAKKALENFSAKNISVIVPSAAFSVDDPTSELAVKDLATEAGLLATGSHEISKLYGLKVRTKTAVINASILPKMVQTANMTEKSVRDANITAPLMIMRCDGGVMSIQEVKNRPILTMLSGPAAGVAGALMYEKVSEGIFLEVGGTSTDISAIHKGQVMVDYAEVGGHKTYVNSLDVRTVGIAGGSMVRISDKEIIDVGPRSAHIAGLPYVVYSQPHELQDPEVVLFQPMPNDFADYVALRCKRTGKMFAFTLACAANASGYIQEEHYAKGDSELALTAFTVLAEYLGKPREQVLAEIHRLAAIKNKRIIEQLIVDYKLNREQLILVGGGGGAAAVVPYLAQELGMKFKVAKNAEVISPIGVALAMVRDMVERTISNPTEEDIVMVRREAEQAALKAGASSETIQVTVEVDPAKSLVRAIATGATELRTGERFKTRCTEDQLRNIAAESMNCRASDVLLVAQSDTFYVFQTEVVKTSLFGLLKHKTYPVRIITNEGVIRLQAPNAKVVTTTVGEADMILRDFISQFTEYGDGGEKIPETYIVTEARLSDLSKLSTKEQASAVLKVELAGLQQEVPIIEIFCVKRSF